MTFDRLSGLNHEFYQKEVQSKIIKLAEAEKQKINYTEIAKKLWTYICIIDDEKVTYEELANSIGLTYDELAYCRRLEK